MAGYPLPPVAPDGGWKNDAQWIGNVEYWSEEMMKLGYGLDDIKKIYTQHIGDPFPKNLANSILAKNWLFPGADMLYTYDLQNHQKKLNQYTSNEGTKGPGEWQPMDPSEIAAVNQYYGWRNDPAHEWMIKQTIDSSGPEGNPYQAWLAQWGDKFKDPNFKPDMFANPNGQAFKATDIHGRSGFDAAGRPLKPTAPVTPPKPTPPNPTPVPGGPKVPGSTNNDVSKAFGDPFSTENANNVAYGKQAGLVSSGGDSTGVSQGMGLTGPNTKFARAVPGTMGTGWGDQMDMPTQRRRFV